jgi:sec-independent protein translocase protein TatA
LSEESETYMLDDLFRGWTPLILLAVVVLLFGATRLPALARSIGQSRNAFKAEMKKGEETGIPAASAKTDSTGATSESTNSTPKS